MAKMAMGILTPGNDSNSNPEEKLKTMLKELYGFGKQHDKLMKFIITQNLLNGEMQAPLFLVPVLKEVFKDQKNEMNLRIIALQILLPIQVASINSKEFHLYSGIDLHDEDQTNTLIDTLVDNVMKANHQVIVFGVSAGGPSAAQFAHDYPDKSRVLILVSALAM